MTDQMNDKTEKFQRFVVPSKPGEKPVAEAQPAPAPVVAAGGAVPQTLKWAEITKLLPHRYPFLLIDRVVAVDPGKSVKAYKNVSANEHFFEGHFPGMPVMPGVLQIEALAQTACVLTLSLPGFSPDTHVAFLMSMDDVKFRRLVEPGDRLDLEVEVLQMKKSIVKVQGRATVDGERAAEAVITAAIRERPKA
jgi:3-hydroxyacyl-[acyl-carrier-protein] dehydratase